MLALGITVGWTLACAGTATQDPSRPLRLAVPGEPSGLDPHLAFDDTSRSVLGNLYETLVALDASMKVVPALAERWENPDERTVRFRLREGVTFHDRRPLTARDVESSLARARRHPRSRVAGLLVAVGDVEVLDDRTIEIRTASPYPILLNKLASVAVVPAGAPETIDEPIGTGPYRLAGFEPESRALLEAWDGHWRGAPPAPRVEVRFVAGAGERLALLTAGEVDLIAGLAPRDVARLEETPGFRVLSRSGLTVEYLQLSPKVAPFDDVRLRQAIGLALDRRVLVEDVLAGHGRPAAQMVGANVYGHDPELGRVEPDLETARRLLVEAGHPDGLELALEPAGRLGEALREQLAAVGVRLSAAAGETPISRGQFACASGDASDFLDLMVYGQVSDRELGRLIELSATLGTEARRGVLGEALRRIADAHVFLPLYAPFDLYGAREEIEWTPRQDGRVYAFEMRRLDGRSPVR
jgi:peptide/nickel transport system substrate-binding protein